MQSVDSNLHVIHARFARFFVVRTHYLACAVNNTSPFLCDPAWNFIIFTNGKWGGMRTMRSMNKNISSSNIWRTTNNTLPPPHLTIAQGGEGGGGEEVGYFIWFWGIYLMEQKEEMEVNKRRCSGGDRLPFQSTSSITIRSRRTVKDETFSTDFPLSVKIHSEVVH